MNASPSLPARKQFQPVKWLGFEDIDEFKTLVDEVRR
jgi:hypothetical protein